MNGYRSAHIKKVSVRELNTALLHADGRKDVSIAPFLGLDTHTKIQPSGNLNPG
jgi:hypothetical protein